MIAREHLPVQLACRVLHVAESGYYASKDRPPSNHLVSTPWLTDFRRRTVLLSSGDARPGALRWEPGGALRDEGAMAPPEPKAGLYAAIRRDARVGMSYLALMREHGVGFRTAKRRWSRCGRRAAHF